MADLKQLVAVFFSLTENIENALNGKLKENVSETNNN